MLVDFSRISFTYLIEISFFLQEANVRRKLQCLQADMIDDEVDSECSAFLDELTGSDTAVSGGGFFLISKDYIGTVSVHIKLFVASG